MLKNTGINFESDGLTGYPTLDASAHDSYGGALGVEYLFSLDRQIVVEGRWSQRMGDKRARGPSTPSASAISTSLNNAWIVRLDAMHGWRQGLENVFGARVELRRKL